MICPAASADGFPRRSFERFGYKRREDSDAAGGFDDEVLVDGFDCDEMGKIAEVIVVTVYGCRVRGNNKFMSDALLFAALTRRKPHQVMGDGYVTNVIVSGRMSDLVEELAHSRRLQLAVGVV